MPLSAVPGFSNNTASGNGGDFMRVTERRRDGPGHDLGRVGPERRPRDLDRRHGPARGRPDVEPGRDLQVPGLFSVTVDGIAHLRGTAYEPIVFTDDADDEFGGDTNGDGPSTGVPASWRGHHFSTPVPPRPRRRKRRHSLHGRQLVPRTQGLEPQRHPQVDAGGQGLVRRIRAERARRGCREPRRMGLHRLRHRRHMPATSRSSMRPPP